MKVKQLFRFIKPILFIGFRHGLDGVVSYLITTKPFIFLNALLVIYIFGFSVFLFVFSLVLLYFKFGISVI
jgi:hypothetical protein